MLSMPTLSGAAPGGQRLCGARRASDHRAQEGPCSICCTASTGRARKEARSGRASATAHLAYLDRHRDILVLGGATLADDAQASRTGSVLIVNVPDRAAADAFAADEPFRKAGLFASYTVTRMRRGQWNPDAAPNSAEGA